MNTVLLLTDLNADKEDFYRYALRFVQRMKANLVLLHIVDHHVAADSKVLDMKRLKTQMDSALVKEATDEMEVTYFIEEGAFADTVKKIIDRESVNLLLMGAADGKNIKGHLFGKKLRAVVEKVNCPILFIPDQVAFQEIEQIVYVTDIRYSDFSIIKQLEVMASLMNAQISLLHVCASGLPELDARTATTLFADTIAPRIRTDIRVYKNDKNDNAEDFIQQLLSNNTQTILAIARRKYHFFDHLFTMNPTEEAKIYKRLPVLIMPV
ncbi:universal stress protein [Olivibacter sp. SDN3]|uniref:universal stress protein n=1 Tax=Olivibacter sp. SDN3 TaxID=2764720 RepID=UPI001651214B|nr:universal stress protein [Olivibacter sp. SDN3]QNL48253.1 universal stress protein [Olivibacter sp. SDN3]